MGKDEERAERLAAQLRANLKRRKEQARGVREVRPAEEREDEERDPGSRPG